VATLGIEWELGHLETEVCTSHLSHYDWAIGAGDRMRSIQGNSWRGADQNQWMVTVIYGVGSYRVNPGKHFDIFMIC